MPGTGSRRVFGNFGEMDGDGGVLDEGVGAVESRFEDLMI